MGFLSRFKLGKPSKWTASEFWAWFASPDGQQAMSGILSSGGKSSESAQKALSASLQRVSPDLVWGVGGGSEGDSRMVLEISAGGLSSLAADVTALVSAAPEVPNWKIVAFKQPQPDFAVSIGEGHESIDSNSVKVWATPRNDGHYDLQIFLPVPADFPAKMLPEVGFIMLDHVLGEFAVMTRMGDLKFQSLLIAPPGVIPLSEFAKQLQGME